MTSNNTKDKIRIAVLFGGRSGEHEVSLVSGTSVIKNLDKDKYEVIPIGITKQGRWITGPDAMKLLKSGKTPKESNAIISPEPQDLSTESNKIVNSLGHIDVVFPVLHGPYGEDGTVQGFLELTGLPYVGCGVLSSAVSMDKVMQKKVLDSENIKQTPYVWFWSKEWEQRKKEILNNLSLSYPVFVKPPNMGSSVGVSKVNNKEDLVGAVEEAIQYDRKVIIEQGVKGVREIEVAVLGNREPKASVAGEIIPSNDFYDYNAKYVDGKTDEKIPADLPEEVSKEIQDIAIKTYKALDAEGMARVDFMLSDDGNIYLNEINTIPGFTSISMYPKLWEASGISYPELLDELIRLAIERGDEKKQIKVEYTPKEEWYNE
jgi:D-alanine-D-alanine ligase